MVSLIIGHKGSGKTKHLIEEVNKAVENSKGNVICIEKKTKLTYDITSRARLIAADSFGINGFDAYYGFVSGICASDNDITDVLADATLRIGGNDLNQLAEFIEKVSVLANATDTRFTFTISADEEELPKQIFDFCQKIY
ncbi:MAG: hypothetical protein GX269_00595 [Clostridiales bacterium]|nr:hypothetical protein [Clostridiales bacterium]